MQETFPRNVVSSRVRAPVRIVPGSSSHQPVRNSPIPHRHSELVTRVELETDSSEEEEESDSTEEQMNTSVSSTDETSSAPEDQGQENIAVEAIPPVAPQLELDEEELPPRLGMNQNRLPRANSSTRLQAFWSSREGQNNRISDMAIRMIAASWRASMEQTYGTYWRRWISWTSDNNLPATSSVLDNVLDFLAHLMEEGLSWQYISGARSALSSTLPPVEVFKIGEHPTVCRLVKGALELRPPIKPLVPQWSVAKVCLLYTSPSPRDS